MLTGKEAAACALSKDRVVRHGWSVILIFVFGCVVIARGPGRALGEVGRAPLVRSCMHAKLSVSQRKEMSHISAHEITHIEQI